jgi:anti-sigma-K factor RskA
MSPSSQAPDHEELRDLCAAYALGALEPPEVERLERHLLRCEACRSDVDAHLRAVGALGTLLDERTPPASAEESLLERLVPGGGLEAIGAAARKEAGRGGWARWLSVAAALLIAVPALWIAVESRREVARLERLLETFETTTDPLVSFYDLEPTAAAGGARARATFDPRTLRWRLFLHDLVQPPTGTIYQGWLVTRDGPLDFGTFLPDGTAHAFLALRLPGEPTGVRVRVTLEPAGGSNRPTGPLVFDYPGAETPTD